MNGTEATRWPVQVGTGFLMSRLGPEIRRLRCELLAEVGLSASHYAVLTAIRQFGPMSQKRLSIIVGTDPRNVVTSLDELDDRSLVQRTRDSADRRRQVVSLTKRGQATIASLDHDADAVDDVFFRQLNSAQRAALHCTLRCSHYLRDSSAKRLKRTSPLSQRRGDWPANPAALQR